MFAVSATESWWALAGVALRGVSAGPAVSAGLILTSLCRCLTMRAMPAFGTLTTVTKRPHVLQTDHNTILLIPQERMLF
jgi:hypothetical protein